MTKTSEARLQLRWTGPEDRDEFGCAKWTCHYELYIPLQDGDIRRKNEDGEDFFEGKTIEIGKTARTSGRVPCRMDDGTEYFDVPFRDGAHALWDSKHLGSLPIVVIAPNGAIIARPDKWGEA